MYRTWEKFGGGKFWRINGFKVFGEEKLGESVGSILKILAFINIGGENFGELPTVRQIRQNFPPPKFSHVRYVCMYMRMYMHTYVCMYVHVYVCMQVCMLYISKHSPMNATNSGTTSRR